MSKRDRATILIADDHPLFREALQWVAGEVFNGHGILEADSFDNARDAVERESFDLVLLDLNMPGMDGFNGLMSLRDAAPSTPIVIVSATEDAAAVREAITCGASGFIPKSLDKEEMVAALRLVLAGAVYTPAAASRGGGQQAIRADLKLAGSISQLSHQQRIVLQMLVSGRPNKQIAYELNIAESTVKAHVSAILRKLKVHSRTQAVIKAGKILSDLKDQGVHTSV